MNIKGLRISNALLVSLIFLALSLSAVPVILGYAEQSQDCLSIPGMPENATFCNKTDVTPTCTIEQVTANKMYVYAYRNVTLMMNCSKTSKLNITLDPAVQTRYLALVMEQNQSALLNLNISVSPPPGVKTMEQTLNFYWGIDPNATLQLRAQLRVHINGTALNRELNRAINMSRLTWMYWNETESHWVPVDSYIDEDGYLTCDTTHFSIWTVAEIIPSQPIQWLTYASIGITVAVMVCGVTLLRRKW